nr:hypothetical protein [Tanacetum cinerariifolium]
MVQGRPSVVGAAAVLFPF